MNQETIMCLLFNILSTFFIGYLGLYFHGYFILFECLDGTECKNLDVFSFLSEGQFMLLDFYYSVPTALRDVC
jgi:hypothetical protein